MRLPERFSLLLSRMHIARREREQRTVHFRWCEIVIKVVIGNHIEHRADGRG